MREILKRIGINLSRLKTDDMTVAENLPLHFKCGVG